MKMLFNLCLHIYSLDQIFTLYVISAIEQQFSSKSHQQKYKTQEIGRFRRYWNPTTVFSIKVSFFLLFVLTHINQYMKYDTRYVCIQRYVDTLNEWKTCTYEYVISIVRNFVHFKLLDAKKQMFLLIRYALCMYTFKSM